jgi:hypothetical protein
MRVQAPVKGLVIESGGGFGKQFVELLKIAQTRNRQQVEADHTAYPSSFLHLWVQRLAFAGLMSIKASQAHQGDLMGIGLNC